jgi:spore coat protein U-like protein
MRRVSRLAIAAAMLAPAAPAGAACTISATGVAFGNYDPQSLSPDDSTGSVNVDCKSTDPAPNVALSAGLSGSYAPRAMTGGSYSLPYNLYTTTARNIVWGDGTSGTVTLTLSGGTSSGGRRLYSQSVYGRIPAGRNVGAGSYSDTIILTVTW